MSGISGKENVLYWRERVLLAGLKLEMKGMKRSRGQSCYAIVKKEYGFKGNKAKVYAQFKELLDS